MASGSWRRDFHSSGGGRRRCQEEKGFIRNQGEEGDELLLVTSYATGWANGCSDASRGGTGSSNGWWRKTARPRPYMPVLSHVHMHARGVRGTALRYFLCRTLRGLTSTALRTGVRTAAEIAHADRAP